MTTPTRPGRSATPPRQQEGTDGTPKLTGYKISLEQMSISNPMGLDLRCAALLARTALQCEAAIEVEYSGRRADGKNLMELVALDVPCNGVVTVSAYGCMAQHELQIIKRLLSTAFTMTETTATNPQPLQAPQQEQRSKT